MVRIRRWIGRFGNNLFQYAAARLVAEKNGLYLETEWPHDDILKVLPWDNNGEKIEPKTEITEDTYEMDKRCIYRDFKKTGLIMDGYFQDASFYYPIRDKIKSWFEPCSCNKNTKDWVCHYRVSDYWMSRVSSVISPRWYEKILMREVGPKSERRKSEIYIISEDQKDECVVELSKRVGGINASDSVKNDFNFLRSFENIICSNGSFAWWAAFLSDFKKCYMFTPWMRFHHNMHLKNFPGVTWSNGDYATNPAKAKEWDIKSENNLERYWEDWKNAKK